MRIAIKENDSNHNRPIYLCENALASILTGLFGLGCSIPRAQPKKPGKNTIIDILLGAILGKKQDTRETGVKSIFKCSAGTKL